MITSNTQHVKIQLRRNVYFAGVYGLDGSSQALGNGFMASREENIPSQFTFAELSE